MLGFIAAQLATLKPRAPTGDRWIHEIKFDGYPAQAHVGRSGTRIYTRSGLNWTAKFTAAALAELPADQAVLDGEIVVVVNQRTDFSALQADLSAKRQNRMLFYALTCCTWTVMTCAGSRCANASDCNSSCWPRPNPR
ncbi:ATPdependent DNA ligase EC 6511 clustered with Ku protein LigD [Bradyrhizobium sp.]|uniref:ATP-dependent DNA ligase n=1 Tax=Bradyrhizobium sp. TaxID=376 RepID=UPI0007C18FB4|nr:hypothetical protein [Bradyrhizobium sp.]CUT11458.1 ATPdependent DNA ligase EC 6511 clustered with Ku protein LigD [Bradyrhizobium sp.]